MKLIDMTSDEDSIPEEILSPDREYNYPRDHVSNIVEQNVKPPTRESSIGMFSGKNNQNERRQKQTSLSVNKSNIL